MGAEVKTARPDARRRDLATIHIAKKQLDMADEIYRDMLWTCARVRSSGDLDHAGRAKVLEHLKACGFVSKASAPSGEWAWVDKAAADRQPMLRKLIMMAKAGGYGRKYIDAVCVKMFGIERLELAGPGQLHKLISALTFHARRKQTPADKMSAIPAGDTVMEMRELLVAAFAPIAGDKARALAEVAEVTMRAEWGGQNIYFAVGTKYHTEFMRQRIKQCWNGQNTVALAKELGVTARRLQQLAAEMRARAQADLFGKDKVA
jgi:Mor family transcriptional regulator